MLDLTRDQLYNGYNTPLSIFKANETQLFFLRIGPIDMTNLSLNSTYTKIFNITNPDNG